MFFGLVFVLCLQDFFLAGIILLTKLQIGVKCKNNECVIIIGISVISYYYENIKYANA